jgi:curved DNA-binding protein CbpA
MSTRDPKFDDYVLKIHAVLDRLTYFRLFGISPTATLEEIKRVFYAMAQRFHPDRNLGAPENVQNAIYDIYKRINEAYRVLCDPEKRAMYEEALKQGYTRLEQDMRSSFGPKHPVDTIQLKAAREMYTKAEEALKSGNLMQADLCIKVALGKEPANEAIRNLLKEILTAKAQKKPS